MPERRRWGYHGCRRRLQDMLLRINWRLTRNLWTLLLLLLLLLRWSCLQLYGLLHRRVGSMQIKDFSSSCISCSRTGTTGRRRVNRLRHWKYILCGPGGTNQNMSPCCIMRNESFELTSRSLSPYIQPSRSNKSVSFLSRHTRSPIGS